MEMQFDLEACPGKDDVHPVDVLADMADGCVGRSGLAAGSLAAVAANNDCGRCRPADLDVVPAAAVSGQVPLAQTAFTFASAVDGLEAARAARDRFEATLPPLRSHVEFRAYWICMRRIGLTCETSPYLREHLRLFLEPVGRPTRAEVVGVVPMSRPVAREAVRLMRIEGGYARRVAARALFDPATFGRDELRAALPPSLRDLPGTWLCRIDGGDFAAIPGSIILRLTRIAAPRLRTAAILEVLLLSAEGTRAGLDVPTAAFERWDDAFGEAGLSPDSADDFLTVAQRYCVVRDLQATHPVGPRISAFERWSAAEHRRAAYAQEHSALASALRKARLPALPAGRPAKQFLRDFNKVRDKYGIDCTGRRKVDADKLSDAFAPRLAAAQLRARQGVRLWREAEAGAAALRLSPGDERQAFCWTEEVVTPGGCRINRLQSIRMEAVFADVVEAELATGGLQHRFRFVEDGLSARDGARDGTDARCPDAADPTGTVPDSAAGDPPGIAAGGPARAIVFRFIEVVALEGGRTVPPWWVAIFSSGVLLGPARLDIGVREARRAAMLELGVRGSGCGPAGLVGPDGPSESRLFQRALNAGVVLVSAEAFGHGMAIGVVAMRTLGVTFARVSEMLQIVRRKGEDAWRQEEVPGRGRRQGWMAIPKGSPRRECFLIYDERTLPLLTTITRMRLLREGLREVPTVEPWRALARKVTRDVYVFAFRGRMLDPDDLNYLYRHLMAGLQRVRNHDLRHAASNRRLRTAGVTEADVAFRLKHAGGSAGLPTRERGRFALARTYGMDTPAQRDLDGRRYCEARLAFERLMGVPLAGDLL